MKKMFTICALLLLSMLHVQAQEFELREAIKRFVSDRNAANIKRMEMRGVDTEGKYVGCQWHVVRYDFSLPEKEASRLEPIIQAYEHDSCHPRLLFSAMEDEAIGSFAVHFSCLHPAATIGSADSLLSRLVVSGIEKDDMNTVCGMAWRQTGKDGKTIIAGTIHIIERAMVFIQMNNKDTAPAEQKKPTNNLRRLKFYADRYQKEAPTGGGAPIVKAMVYVVSDIIQTGDTMELNKSKELIDTMIAATPTVMDNTAESVRSVVMDNEKTLLTLLARLDTPERSHNDATPQTFTIDGEKTNELKDIGYYISMSDDSETLGAAKTTLVKAEGQTFFYQTELTDIKYGRVRALFKDGRVCSGFMDFLFVPCETAHLSVHSSWSNLDESSSFYRQYYSAQSMIGNKQSEQQVLDFLEKNLNKPGYIIYAFEKQLIRDKKTMQYIYNKLPDSMKDNHYGRFLRRYL